MDALLTEWKLPTEMTALEKARALAEARAQCSIPREDVWIFFTARGYQVNYLHPLLGEVVTLSEEELELEPSDWFEYLKEDDYDNYDEE